MFLFMQQKNSSKKIAYIHNKEIPITSSDCQLNVSNVLADIYEPKI